MPLSDQYCRFTVFNFDNSFIFSAAQSPSHFCREPTIENSQLRIDSSFSGLRWILL